MKKEARVRVFVGDVLFEDLSKERHEEIKDKITEKVSSIVSSYVLKMVEEGKSEKEIRKFLKLDQDEICCTRVS